LIVGQILGLPRRSHFPFAIADASETFHLRLDVFARRAFGFRSNRSFPFAAAIKHITGPTPDGTAAVPFGIGRLS
jgi:hypothetical protein